MTDKLFLQFKQFKEILKKSELNDEEKILWRFLLLNAGEQGINSILEVLQEKPKVLKFLTENLKKKLTIIKTKDENAWNCLMAEEKDFLDKN